MICTTLCAHRYISRVRSSQVLIFMYGTLACSGYYDGRSCPICTRCFHRCSARIPAICCAPVDADISTTAFMLMQPSLFYLFAFCLCMSLDHRFEVTVTSVSLPPFVSRRGLFKNSRAVQGVDSHSWCLGGEFPRSLFLR